MNDIFYTIVDCLILIVMVAYAVVLIIRKVKGQDTETREAILQFTACLIEQGVKIPDDLLVKILRGKITLDKLTQEVKSLVK